MKKLLCTVFCLSLCLSVQAASTIWKVTSADKPFFLVGSIHVLKASDYPLPAVFEKVYEASEQLYFEVDMGKMQDPAVMMAMMKEAMFQDGRTLKGVLKEDTYAMLEKYCTESGLPIASLQTMKPWMVMTMMMMVELKKMGTGPEHGIDTYFHKKAVADKKPVGGLETPEEQLQAFNAIDGDLNDMMVKKTIQEMAEMKEMMNDLLTAWRKGDLKQIDKYISDEMRCDYPALYKSLLVDRNKAWTPKIDKLIKSGKSGMVVVGSGHLIGDDSVIKMLEAKGHKIERFILKK